MLAGLVALLVVGALGVASCGGPEGARPGATLRDSDPDGLFADFLDGKYDSAGHPFGAIVFEAESGCTPTTGAAEVEGWAARAGEDEPGLLCRATTANFSQGVYTVNVRALVHEDVESHDAMLGLSVIDASGDVVAERQIRPSDLQAPMTFQNLSLTLDHGDSEPVTVELAWHGVASVRVDYIEIFRSTRQLVVSPASGLLTDDDGLQLELTDPPTGVRFEVTCGEVDLTPLLEELLEDGTATATTTEFRTIVTVPHVPSFLGACPFPTRVMVQAVTNTWVRATSRVTYLDAPPACAFEEGKPKVLLTGFEPFPADSTSDNSSEHAIQGYSPDEAGDVSVMRLTLPVEYDTASAWIDDVVDRCEPDIVIGFGQGRSIVDLETTAYNIKDTGSVSFGVPDNRGVIFVGEEIVSGGPEELESTLPLDAIRSRIATAGISVSLSDDPGRYVCNNVFYSIAHKVAGTGRLGGFVHLPRIPYVDEEAKRELQTVVDAAVAEAVSQLP